MTTRTARTPVTVPTVTRGCGSPARTVHTAERARAAAQGVGAPVSIARAMRIFGGHSGAVCTRDARFYTEILFLDSCVKRSIVLTCGTVAGSRLSPSL